MEITESPQKSNADLSVIGVTGYLLFTYLTILVDKRRRTIITFAAVESSTLGTQTTGSRQQPGVGAGFGSKKIIFEMKIIKQSISSESVSSSWTILMQCLPSKLSTPGVAGLGTCKFEKKMFIKLKSLPTTI